MTVSDTNRTWPDSYSLAMSVVVPNRTWPGRVNDEDVDDVVYRGVYRVCRGVEAWWHMGHGSIEACGMED